MVKLAAVALGWLALWAAPAGRASEHRQDIVVDCGESCDAVSGLLRRMGAETSPRADAGRLGVRIDAERLPEVPMIRGVRAAFKEPRTESAAAPKLEAPAATEPGGERGAAAARLVAPGKAVELEPARPGLIRTAGAADRTGSIQRSADLPPATASGKVAQNDLVPVLVEVPAGTRELSFLLLWEERTSDDLDLIVLAPDGHAEVEGATLRNPERVVVRNPTPGVWTAFVNGFAMNGSADEWQLGVTADGVPLGSR